MPLQNDAASEIDQDGMNSLKYMFLYSAPAGHSSHFRSSRVLHEPSRALAELGEA